MTAAILTFALLTPAQPAQQAAPDVKDTIRSGLTWFAGQQKEDGGWAGTNGVSRTSVTATAGIAFLMEGSTPKAGAYAPQIRKALACLEKNTQESGLIAGKNEFEVNMPISNHAAAILFLACVADVDDEPERLKSVAKLIKNGIAYLVDAQSSRGGWGLVAARDGNDYDESMTTAVVLQALYAARKAGFGVPKEVTDRGVQYLVKATNRQGGVIYSNFGGALPDANTGLPFATASAAAALLMFEGVRPEALPRWVRSAHGYSLPQIRGLRNVGSYGLFQQYHMARACYALGESTHARLDPSAKERERVTWSAYRAPLFKELKEWQGKDGSWSDIYVGPAYSTALALITLQLDNDYLPAFSR